MKKLRVLSVIAAAALMCTAMSCDSDPKPVEEVNLTDISANYSSKKTFFVGEDFSYEGLIVKAFYSDNSKKIVKDGFTASLPQANLDENSKIKRNTSEGHSEIAKVTVSYEGFTTGCDVTISDVVSRIEISVDKDSVKTSYNVGDALDTTGVSVKAFYSEDDTTGEDITAIATISASLTTADDSTPIDFDNAPAGKYSLTFTASYATISASSTTPIEVEFKSTQAGGSDAPADTGSESDLSAYVYHKSIIATMADPWGSGTNVTVADNKATLVSGNLWGAGGVCGVSTVGLGEIADYEYIVFTVDASNYTISDAQENLDSNTGVNIKIPDVIKRPTKWFTKDGKTTYYIATSEFSSVSTAITIALIIGGEGTLVVEDFYLAATEEPAEKVVEHKNTTVYESGVTLKTAHWWGEYTHDCVDGNIVSKGLANACYGLEGFTPIPFKEGAKLEVTYKSTKDWAVKPIAPDAETSMAASENFTTVTVSLGAASNLTAVGIVHKADDSEITISSIKVIDNE